jgi:hypothetical protein
MNERFWLADGFEADRTPSCAVAYRMPASINEADDAVQEAWLRLGRLETWSTIPWRSQKGRSSPVEPSTRLRVRRPPPPRLVERGHEVTGMTRSESKQPLIRDLGGRPVVGDALDPESVAQAVAASEPEAIVHQLTAIPHALDMCRAQVSWHCSRRSSGRADRRAAPCSRPCRRRIRLRHGLVGGGCGRQLCHFGCARHATRARPSARTRTWPTRLAEGNESITVRRACSSTRVGAPARPQLPRGPAPGRARTAWR